MFRSNYFSYLDDEGLTIPRPPRSDMARSKERNKLKTFVLRERQDATDDDTDSADGGQREIAIATVQQ